VSEQDKWLARPTLSAKVVPLAPCLVAALAKPMTPAASQRATAEEIREVGVLARKPTLSPEDRQTMRELLGMS
jgi:hypothetical protein